MNIAYTYTMSNTKDFDISFELLDGGPIPKKVKLLHEIQSYFIDDMCNDNKMTKEAFEENSRFLEDALKNYDALIEGETDEDKKDILTALADALGWKRLYETKYNKELVVFDVIKISAEIEKKVTK